MAEHPISPGLRNFIADNIQSVEHLEILCLLAEDPSRSWSVADVYRRILSTEKSVAEGLQYFCANGLLTADPRGEFRFTPKTSELNVMTQELVKSYRERRVAVIESIYKKSSDSAQHFAEAFRLRKEK
ncbi:MAG TPA: hypothetical protein VH597_06875 [Verrucomicrobiae bacterium]|jgi:hypothetical protein|nr:hypothetical protein [Verrucomicrobiae bacterium]